MAKGNNFYLNQTVYFATKHKKEEILAPLFSRLGLLCKSVPVDTDVFGTFSGEIERVGTIRETLRKKIQAAVKLEPKGRLFLASEGSFTVHPHLPFSDCDLESLLLWDKDLNFEIYAEYLDSSPVHEEIKVKAHEDINPFLTRIQFPHHAVIVQPDAPVITTETRKIFKGLKTVSDVQQAIAACALESATGQAIVAVDLRADQNLSRRKAIELAGEQLIQKLKSPCPSCGTPGFWITGSVPGLKCLACGEPSEHAAEVIYECAKCFHTEYRARPDGKTGLDPDFCEHCNP